MPLEVLEKGNIIYGKDYMNIIYGKDYMTKGFKQEENTKNDWK